ncbi:MAG: hypothetical protein R3B84_14470 [Zavarzinella sp.]
MFLRARWLYTLCLGLLAFNLAVAQVDVEEKVEDKEAAKLKGQLSGTKWTSMEGTVNGQKIPAGVLKLEFNKDGTMRYQIVDMVYTGKYEVIDGKQVKWKLDQELGGNKEHIEKLAIKGKTLTVTDQDGTALDFEIVGKPKVEPKQDPELKSDNKGLIEGTKWVNLKGEIKGTPVAAGFMKFEFNKDGTLVYTLNGRAYEGKYELLPGKKVKLITKESIGGRRENIETIVINGNKMTASDTSGAGLEFEQIGGKNKPVVKKTTKELIADTKWANIEGDVKGQKIQAGLLKLEFTKDGKMVYDVGGNLYEGTYEFLEENKVKWLFTKDLGSRKDHIEGMEIKNGNLIVTDSDGTKLEFAQVKKAAPKEEPMKQEPKKEAKGNKEKLPGTKWANIAGKVKGQDIPAGLLKLEFNKDGTMLYDIAGDDYRGKYEIMEDNKVKWKLEKELGGRKEHVETLTFDEKGNLVVKDADGTTLTFRPDSD